MVEVGCGEGQEYQPQGRGDGETQSQGDPSHCEAPGEAQQHLLGGEAVGRAVGVLGDEAKPVLTQLAFPCYANSNLVK